MATKMYVLPLIALTQQQSKQCFIQDGVSCKTGFHSRQRTKVIAPKTTALNQLHSTKRSSRLEIHIIVSQTYLLSRRWKAENSLAGAKSTLQMNREAKAGAGAQRHTFRHRVNMATTLHRVQDSKSSARHIHMSQTTMKDTTCISDLRVGQVIANCQNNYHISSFI